MSLIHSVVSSSHAYHSISTESQSEHQQNSCCRCSLHATYYNLHSIYPSVVFYLRLNNIRIQQKLSPVSTFSAGRIYIIYVVLCGARIDSDYKTYLCSLVSPGAEFRSCPKSLEPFYYEPLAETKRLLSSTYFTLVKLSRSKIHRSTQNRSLMHACSTTQINDD
jgi:hypothetical protein